MDNIALIIILGIIAIAVIGVHYFVVKRSSDMFSEKQKMQKSLAEEDFDYRAELRYLDIDKIKTIKDIKVILAHLDLVWQHDLIEGSDLEKYLVPYQDSKTLRLN